MSVSVSVNGTAYQVPTAGEVDWAAQLTALLQGLGASTLQPNSGTFTLSAELDFGASFGLKSLYYKSRTANPASTGAVRLANADRIYFRDSSNVTDVAFGPGSSNAFAAYNGVDLVNLSGSQTLTNKSLSGASNTFTAIPNSATTATNANTASAIVTRDGSGDFSAGIITATAHKSSTANAAATGALRLANADRLVFRNSVNSNDISFGPGSTDSIPSYGGVDLATIAATQTLTNKTLTSPSITSPSISSPTITGTTTIAVPAWTAVTYQNSWVDFGGGYGGAAYTKDSFGFVHLRGLIKNGSMSSAAFTLPVGFRPVANIYQISVSNNAVGVIDIRTDGSVIPQVGSNIHFGLDSVVFATF